MGSACLPADDISERWSKQTIKMQALCTTGQHRGQMPLEVVTRARIRLICCNVEPDPECQEMTCVKTGVSYTLSVVNSSCQHSCLVAHLVPIEL